MALGPRLDLRQIAIAGDDAAIAAGDQAAGAVQSRDRDLHRRGAGSNPLLEAGRDSATRGEANRRRRGRATDPANTAADGGSRHRARSISTGGARRRPDRATANGAARRSGGVSDEVPHDRRARQWRAIAGRSSCTTRSALSRMTREAFIAAHLIGELDEAGYFTGDLRDVPTSSASRSPRSNAHST